MQGRHLRHRGMSWRVEFKGQRANSFSVLLPTPPRGFFDGRVWGRVSCLEEMIVEDGDFKISLGSLMARINPKGQNSSRHGYEPL